MDDQPPSSSQEPMSSETFKRHLQELTAQWKGLLRRNKKVLLKCPNYEKCQYKCGSIGGMQYHYPRCAGACPMFKCNLCGREYESRTGLNYHNASHHTGVGVVLNSENGKRTQRKERRTESHEGDQSVPPPPPVIVPSPPPVNPTPLSSSTLTIPSTLGLPLPLTTPSSSTHILPSLLKHSTSTVTTAAVGGATKGRKGGRSSSKANKASNEMSGDTISLEGVVKTSEGKDKKIMVNIPSIEYPDEYRSYLPEWRDQLKATQSVLCPNFDHCQFQCTTVNGMKYHFIRCQKEKLPEFSCSLCDRSFHCRSGLVWHLKNTHKLADIPANQKSFEIMLNKEERMNEVKEELKGSGRKRKPSQPLPHSSSTTAVAMATSTTPTTAAICRRRQSPRKNGSPRPTAKFYLKYLETQEKPVSYTKPKPTAWSGPIPPAPKLRPQPPKVTVSQDDFTLTHEIQTDEDTTKSLVVEYSEELLTQWHKWYSSDSSDYEDSYDDEFDDAMEGIGKSSAHTFTKRVYRDSSSSCSEASSDEDYTEYAQPKGRGKGRGTRGRRRGKANESARSFVPPIPSLLSSNNGGNSKQSLPGVRSTAANLVKATPVEAMITNTSQHPIRTTPKPAVKTTPTTSQLPLAASSVKSSVHPVPVAKLHEVKIASTSSGAGSGASNEVKLIKPLKLTGLSTSGQTTKTITSPQNLITMVGPGKGQSLSGSVITLSPGNYYQLQHVPSTNLVQLVSPTQNNTAGTTYHVPSNRLVLVQQPGSQPQYATLQTNVSTPQKVSVIMNPRHVTLATIGTASTSHGVITQLDGPKGKRKASKASSEQLDEEFERVRKKARQDLAGSSTGNIEADNEMGGVTNDMEVESSPVLPDKVEEQKTPKKRGRKKKSDTAKGSITELQDGALSAHQATPTNLTTPTKAKAGSKEKKSFICPTCKEGFPNQRACKTHQETTHLPVSPEATVAERQPHWRNSIKKHKYVMCDKCNNYKGKSVTAMKYHYERCQTNQTKSYNCPECDKVYTSLPGLNYHLKYGHVEQPEEVIDEQPSDADICLSGQRKAADSAAKKLREMNDVGKPPARDATTREGSPPSEDEVASTDGRGSEGILSNETKKSLKEVLSKEGVVKCPIDECEQKYKTLPGILYHLRTRHLYGKKFRCPKCKALLLSKKKIINHMTKRHPDYEVTDYDELQFVPEDSESSDTDKGDHGDSGCVGDADEDDVVRVVEDHHSKRINTVKLPLFKMCGSTSYPTVVRNLKKRLHSDQPLFEEYKITKDDYTAVSESELSEFVPELCTSIKYDDTNISEECIERFKVGSDGKVFFAGGPVWAMDWLPYQTEQECDSSNTEYVALSAYRNLSELHSVEGIEVGKGLIQIWQVDDLEAESDCPKVSFSLGICYEDWGIIRNMKWCPSGTTSLAETDSLSRLGLLALACTDGMIRLLSVPHPSSVSALSLTSPAPFIKPIKVSAVLRPCHRNSHTSFGQCLTIDWLPDNRHSKMAAGYSNGSIVIWNLKSTLPFLTPPPPDSAHAHRLFNPALVLLGHNGPCRSVAWVPQDSHYMFSAGQDKTVCMWDIRQPHQPLQKIERSNIQLKVIAPLVWPSLLSIEESSSSSALGNSVLMAVLFHSMKQTRLLPTSPSPISCAEYNVNKDVLVSGSHGGDLVSVSLSYSLHLAIHSKTKKPSKCTVLSSRLKPLTTPTNLRNTKPSCHYYDIEEILENFKVVFQQHNQHTKDHDKESKDDESEGYFHDYFPLTAITSLSWCPHSNHCNWLMMGTNCGLVRIIRT